MRLSNKGVFAFLAAGAIVPSALATVGVDPGRESVPSAKVVADGLTYDLGKPRLAENESGKAVWVLDDIFVQGNGGGFQITGGLEMNPDPSIGYGLAVSDFGAPSSFLFVFSVPIVPTGSPNVVNGSVVGGLTDMTGDGVSITPTGSSLQINDLLAPLTNMGVDVGVADVHPASGTPGSFYTYGAYAAGPIAGPGPGPWTGLQVTVGFGLSGGGDIAALTGFASIEQSAVPESSTMMAGGALALGIAGWAWRRRSQA